MDYTARSKSYLLQQHPHHLNTSFSSSLLDQIYKSFDETTTTTTTIMKKKMMSTQTCIHAPVTTTTTTTRTSTNKHHYSNGASVRGAGGIIRDSPVKEESTGRVKQRNVVDKWVLDKKKKKGNEKQVVENNNNNNNINLRKKTAASVPVDTHRYFHSTSTSSDSSSGGGFSSSETESTTKSTSASFFVKPIRTRKNSTVDYSEQSKSNGYESRSGSGNGKAKSRAMKIYNDLKQPISPGGKISSFLNSLFTPKKSSYLVDNNDFPATTKSTFTRTAVAPPATTPTSASRSCLSKTPNGKQRSVRFYPINIIVDDKHHESKLSREQSHHRHHYQQRSSEEEFKKKISITNNNNHQKLLIEQVIDIDKLLNRNYQRTDDNHLKVEEEDYDDDRDSYASSDLFELDNLSTIGLENAAARFSEELPVYETTHFKTNRTIANGFRL